MSKSKTFLFLILFVLSGHAVFAHPQRIISLKPNITEILFALGVGDRVIGVTKYCDYPEETKKLPKVADYTRPFVEPIIALKPDLIVSSKEESSRKSIEELEKIGIEVAIFPFTTLNETMSSIKGISKIVGREEQGEKIVNEMQSRLNEIRKKWAGAHSMKALVIVGRRPLIVSGHGTYVDEFLSLLGIQNVVPEGSAKYPRWSSENIIVSDPDIIIDLSMDSDAKRDEKSVLESWNYLTTVKAVKEKRIYPLDISVFRQSPRIAGEIDKLGEMIYARNVKGGGE